MSTTTTTIRVNGVNHTAALDPRVTLLDALREAFQLPGTKKGCDQDTCGACTVILDGQRVLSCLTFAATCAGREVQTIDGLATGDTFDDTHVLSLARTAAAAGRGGLRCETPLLILGRSVTNLDLPNPERNPS